jgi:2-polyprenyl-3-methyl-5-hydroxy-6-metoxy-1,4-benzoquinol methylase
MRASLRERVVEPELMDDPAISRERHEQALRGLRRINWLSNSAGIVWPSLRTLARRLGRPIRVLDVATGGGDVPIALYRRAQRAGIAMEISACDCSVQALEYAARRAVLAGAAIHLFPLDAVNEPLPDTYDAVVTSLFLHHLEHPDAVRFLRNLSPSTRHLLLVNDLSRGWAGYAAAWLGTRALSRARIVHVDGPQSVRAAYNPVEARALAAEAGLTGAVVARRWPFRFLLTWNPS